MTFSKLHVGPRGSRLFAACTRPGMLAGVLLAQACSSSSTEDPTQPGQGQPDTALDSGRDAGGVADAASDAADENDNVTCSDGERIGSVVVEPYAPNTVLEGAHGTQFVIVSADPAPPRVGAGTWVAKVLDASGNPRTDATLKVPNPFMPQHQHSSKITPVVTPNADGTYTIGNLDFFMPGVWQVTIQATSSDADAGSDVGVFTFCIPN